MKSLNGYIANTFILCYSLSLIIFFLKQNKKFHFHMQVFISIALILGDGLYNFLKTLFFTVRSMHGAFNKKNLKAGEHET